MPAKVSCHVPTATCKLPLVPQVADLRSPYTLTATEGRRTIEGRGSRRACAARGGGAAAAAMHAAAASPQPRRGSCSMPEPESGSTPADRVPPPHSCDFG